MARLLPSQALRKLRALYSRMDNAYVQAAEGLGLQCEGCLDNCCTTYFHHHTRIEWAYLWQGVDALREEERRAALERAEEYMGRSAAALSRGEKPREMCPLNKAGKCMVYAHRLMICRLHGVPNGFRLPDGRVRTFPGCVRSQSLIRNMEHPPLLDRTPFYRDLAQLETAFCGGSRVEKVDMPLAQMLRLGRP